jgi:hypothetical protein
LTRFRTAVLRRSCRSRPLTPVFLLAVSQVSRWSRRRWPGSAGRAAIRARPVYHDDTRCPEGSAIAVPYQKPLGVADGSSSIAVSSTAAGNGLTSPCAVESFLTVARFDHGVALEFQVLPQQGADSVVILNEEDACHDHVWGSEGFGRDSIVEASSRAEPTPTGGNHGTCGWNVWHLRDSVKHAATKTRACSQARWVQRQMPGGGTHASTREPGGRRGESTANGCRSGQATSPRENRPAGDSRDAEERIDQTHLGRRARPWRPAPGSARAWVCGERRAGALEPGSVTHQATCPAKASRTCANDHGTALASYAAIPDGCTRPQHMKGPPCTSKGHCPR